MTEQEAFNELSYYTLSHPDPSFIHQLIVDAFAAQTADENTKPIKITFALVGLYLHIEKGYTGKEVQRAHMQLAKRKKDWPTFDLPEQRGDMRVENILKANPGKERDEAIEKWCRSVWDSYKESHKKIAYLIESTLYPD